MTDRARLILRVSKAAALSRLRELLDRGEQLLRDERPDDVPYIIGVSETERERNQRSVFAQFRLRTIQWCQDVQEQCLELFDGHNITEEELIGGNKMYPRTTVLRRFVEQIESDSVPVFTDTFDLLHSKISLRAKRNFYAGHFEDSIFDAFKALESELRSRAGAEIDEVGVPLVSRVLNPSHPLLLFSNVKAEQESTFFLFRGAIGILKNPLSHRFVEVYDSGQAFEAICFASLLMRMLDRAVLQRRPKTWLSDHM